MKALSNSSFLILIKIYQGETCSFTSLGPHAEQTHIPVFMSNLIFVPAGQRNAVILPSCLNQIGWATRPSHIYWLCTQKTDIGTDEIL